MVTKMLPNQQRNKTISAEAFKLMTHSLRQLRLIRSCGIIIKLWPKITIPCLRRENMTQNQKKRKHRKKLKKKNHKIQLTYLRISINLNLIKLKRKVSQRSLKNFMPRNTLKKLRSQLKPQNQLNKKLKQNIHLLIKNFN